MTSHERVVSSSEKFDPRRYNWVRQHLVAALGKNHGSEETTELPKLSAQRAQELFLSGFLTKRFQMEGKDGRVRISSETERPQSRVIFKRVLEEWGLVSSSPSTIKADIDPGKIAFLEEDRLSDVRSGILQDKGSFAVYFAGIWAARELLTQMTLHDSELEEGIVQAFERYYKPGLIHSLSRGRVRERILVIPDIGEMIEALRGTESVKLLPFIDIVLPDPKTSA